MLCPSSRCPWRRYGAVLWLTKRCAGPAAVALGAGHRVGLKMRAGLSQGEAGAADCGEYSQVATAARRSFARVAL